MNDIGNNLKRIRLLKNLSLKKAGNLVGITATAVSKYEKGEIIPNSDRLIDFANAYDVKVLDLLKTYKVPEMKFNNFRKKARLQGQNLELLKEIIQNKVADYLEVVEMNNIKANNNKLKKYVCSSLEDAEKAAETFKKDYGLSINQPISDLISILENLGILIVQIKNTDNRFSDFNGLSEVVNGFPFIVLLNDDDGARQRFTIAHELAHLILDINNSKSDVEIICNRFASSLLMPKEAVIMEFGESRSKISFFELRVFKRKYKVSIPTAVRRLRELNIISEYLYKSINIFFNPSELKKYDLDLIEEEISFQFKRLVHKLEVDNIISLNKACELLGITSNEYFNEDYNYRY